MRTTTKKCYGLVATSLFWVTISSHFLFSHLASESLFACHSLFTSFNISYMESLLAGCYGFHCCERWLHHHHNGSVNSKHTHTTKSICQVLTSFLALDIWARVDKIAQTLICSQTCQFQSLLRDLSPINGRNCSIQGSYPFKNKKFKEFSRTFKDSFPIFQGLHLVQKRALSLSFLVLPQHEQFYPDRSFCVCSF